MVVDQPAQQPPTGVTELRLQTRRMGVGHARLVQVHLMGAHHRPHLRREVVREPMRGHKVLTVTVCIVKVMMIIGWVLGPHGIL